MNLDLKKICAEICNKHGLNFHFFYPLLLQSEVNTQKAAETFILTLFEENFGNEGVFDPMPCLETLGGIRTSALKSGIDWIAEESLKLMTQGKKVI